MTVEYALHGQARISRKANAQCQLLSNFVSRQPASCGLQALSVQGKLFRPMSMDWATGDWFATIGIGTLAVVQYRYPPLPAARAVGSQDQTPKP